MKKTIIFLLMLVGQANLNILSEEPEDVVIYMEFPPIDGECDFAQLSEPLKQLSRAMLRAGNKEKERKNISTTSYHLLAERTTKDGEIVLCRQLFTTVFNDNNKERINNMLKNRESQFGFR